MTKRESMTREEAKEAFRNSYASQIERSEEERWEQVNKKLDCMQESLLEGILRLEKERKRQKKEPFQYIQCSLLRTDLMKRKSVILLQGMGEEWHLDPDPISQFVPVEGWLEKERLCLWDSLCQKAKIYRGKVNQWDVGYWMVEEWIKEIHWTAFGLRFFLRTIENSEKWKSIEQDLFFQIQYGEYRADAYLIYRKDQRKKSRYDFEMICQDWEKNQDALIYSCWFELELEKGKWEERNFLYTKWEQCRLSNVSFARSDFRAAQFRNCRFVGMSFAEANLEQAEFSHCQMEDCDFTGANVKDAVFSEEVVPYLLLAPRQMQQIQIRREKAQSRRKGEENGCVIS